MHRFTVETECGTDRTFESRREAEEARETHATLCDECEESDVAIRPAVATAAGPAEGDGEPSRPQGGTEVRDAPGQDLPEEMPDSVRVDPLDVIPGYMIDEVKGQPTINKRGYAVIANHFDIVVAAEPITAAGETDHEYAEFRARAWRKDEGPEHAYTGHATARASEDRSRIEDNLNEMAETRAMKRAVAWASGVGILAYEEMAGYLDE